MNVLYMVITPYHVKMSNYIASTMYRDDNNMIIMTDTKHTRCDILKKFIDLDRFISIEAYNYNIKCKEILTSFIENSKKLNLELENMIKSIDKFNPDVIIYFVDHEPVYQIVLELFKNRSKKIIVEEGLGIYADYSKKDIKSKIIYKLYRAVYKKYKFRNLRLGESGYEDFVYAREPELTNIKNGTAINISRNEYKKIFSENLNKNIILNAIGTLFCPSLINYKIEKAKMIYKDIFEYYYNNKETLYVKLHPAERNIQWIENLSLEYAPYIKFIDKTDITSDELLVNHNIKAVISDYSSLLINAPYIREDLTCITYLGMMQNEYKIKVDFKSKLFKYLLDKGIIKSFKNYKVNI